MKDLSMIDVRKQLVAIAKAVSNELDEQYLDYKENTQTIKHLEKVLSSVRVDINRMNDYFHTVITEE